jgi:hypothetical protein
MKHLVQCLKTFEIMKYFATIICFAFIAFCADVDAEASAGGPVGLNIPFNKVMRCQCYDINGRFNNYIEFLCTLNSSQNCDCKYNCERRFGVGK